MPDARMPLERPEKPVQKIIEGGSWGSTGEGVKRTSEALIEFNSHTPEEQEIIVSQSLERLECLLKNN